MSREAALDCYSQKQALSSAEQFNHTKGGTWTQKTEALLSFLKLDILVFLVYPAYVEAAKFVLVNRGIITERGQMANVTETKLRLNLPRESRSCKVGKVVLNETVTESWNMNGSGRGLF